MAFPLTINPPHLLDKHTHMHPLTHTHLGAREIMWWWESMYTCCCSLSPPEPCSADCEECQEEANGTTVTCTECNPGFTLNLPSNECNQRTSLSMYPLYCSSIYPPTHLSIYRCAHLPYHASLSHVPFTIKRYFVCFIVEQNDIPSLILARTS